VHLVHEAKLAQGEAIRKDNVADGDEGLGQVEVVLGPELPWYRVDAAWEFGRAYSCGNDSNEDSRDDGDKVDVAQDGHLAEGGRDGDDEQQNGRHDGEHDGAGAVVAQVVEHDGARQHVRADGEDELQHKHGADDFVADLAEHHAPGVRVVRDLRVLELHLPDHIAGVHGDEPDAHREDHSGNHTQGRERPRQAEAAQRHGRHDQHDGQPLPAELVELVLALGHLLRLVVRHVGVLAHFADLIVRRRARKCAVARCIPIFLLNGETPPRGGGAGRHVESAGAVYREGEIGIVVVPNRG
jgi:hypothetical protein